MLPRSKYTINIALKEYVSEIEKFAHLGDEDDFGEHLDEEVHQRSRGHIHLARCVSESSLHLLIMSRMLRHVKLRPS